MSFACPSPGRLAPPATAFARISLAAVLTVAVATSAARAQHTPETLYDVVSLAAAADAEIDNDLMSATLVVQAEAKDPAELADQINATMRWALNELSPYAAIARETRDYRTWPRYDSSQARRLIGWRGSQTLVLESDDFAAMARAIQKLQERLQVLGTALSAKPATRRRATEALIDEALRAFRRRARLIQTSLGASGYRILEIDVQSDEGVGEGPMPMALDMAMRSDAMAVTEPAVAGGTSRVAVRVHGRVQLDDPRSGSGAAPADGRDEEGER